MEPDATDTKILKALMEDGRASFRQIAQMTSLTTPTVSVRFARMKKAGLIKRFVPILSADSLSHRLMAIITLRVEAKAAESVASGLSRLDEVEHVYMTTGQGLTIKVSLDDAEALQLFLKRHLLGKPHVEVVSSEIVTSVVKEEPSSSLPGKLTMHLKCDYCGGDVSSSRPHTISVGTSHYYFCCRTCRKEYLEDHGERLQKINNGPVV